MFGNVLDFVLFKGYNIDKISLSACPRLFRMTGGPACYLRGFKTNVMEPVFLSHLQCI